MNLFLHNKKYDLENAYSGSLCREKDSRSSTQEEKVGFVVGQPSFQLQPDSSLALGGTQPLNYKAGLPHTGWRERPRAPHYALWTGQIRKELITFMDGTKRERTHG